MGLIGYSIALCTYKGEKYIRQQLDSYFNQTVLPSEIIVCDDGSTDDTLAIVGEYASLFPLVKWHIEKNKANLGPRRNFGKAISLCSGEYIFLSDQDDIWLPQKAEMALAFFNSNPDILGLASNGSLIDEASILLPDSLWEGIGFASVSDITSKNASELYRFILLHGNVVTGATVAVRKEALQYVLPYDNSEMFWHDEWIALVLSALGKFALVDENWIQYRTHSHQSVGVKTLEERKEWVARIKTMKEKMADPQNFPNLLGYYNAAFLRAKEIEKKLVISTSVKEGLFENVKGLKHQMLNSQGWLTKKIKLAKWAIDSSFDTTWSELI